MGLCQDSEERVSGFERCFGIETGGPSVRGDELIARAKPGPAPSD